MTDETVTRRPLAKAEKFRPRTVKMPDSLWQRFTDAALAEGDSCVSTFVRSCAIVGLEHRLRDQAFSAYRGRTGMTAVAGGHTRGRTDG